MAIQTANLESNAQNTDQIYLFFFILFIDIPVCLFLQMAVGTLNTLSIEQLLQNVVLRIFEFILRAILTLKHVVILCLRIECASMTCWRISSDETQPRMNFSSLTTNTATVYKLCHRNNVSLKLYRYSVYIENAAAI